MSGRLTTKWAKTNEDAFGEMGRKGDLGEAFVRDVLDAWGWEVELTEDNRKEQVAGIDIRFRNPNWSNFYTADVKNNMDKYGTIFIDITENGWLYGANKCSDRIWHCNVDTGWMAWYDREKMKEYIRTLPDSCKEPTYVRLSVHQTPDFVKRQRYQQEQDNG